MNIQLIGGPLDGIIFSLDNRYEKFSYFIAENHEEKPIYRSTHCPCCAAKLDIVDYLFAGYEKQSYGSFDELVLEGSDL